MRCPSAITDESGRLLALNEYGLDEQKALPDLEPVVHIAARMFDMPVAAINMVGSDHVFFAASIGIGECDMRRDVSFCAHAITQDEVMVVLDATLDTRFHDNPLVTGSAGIRFYAGIPLHSPSGHALGALCVIDSRPRSSFSQQDRERLKDLARLASDKLELRRLENARENGLFRFEDIATTSPTPILCFDGQHTITFWNAAASALFGYAASDVVGKPLSVLAPVINEHPLLEMIDSVISAGQTSLGGSVRETFGFRSDGSFFPVEISLFSWNQGDNQHFGVMLTDITEKRNQEDELHRLANFDPLTGAANRNLLLSRVANELDSGSPAAIIVIGLDNFKDVNDTLGTSVGDRVLSAIAGRISQCIRPIDTLARIGGDEFAILLSQTGDHIRSSSVAESVIAAIALPIQVEDHEVHVAASCGIAFSPAHGQQAEELIGNADLALYQAKAGGRGRSFVYVPSLRQEAIHRRMYQAELHRALEAGEFELFYQPQVRISDGKIVGAEALIRWNHPEKGYLAPAVFLPALESGALACAVGDQVLENACAQLAQWQEQKYSLRIGVNLFSAQFHKNDLDLRVTGIIDRYNLPPNLLELEITENVILDRDNHALAPLQRLRAIGVGIAFDDFGTGYASLSLLKDYPLTRIKIDQSFIRSMCTSRRDEATVAAAINLARIYDLEVIAEGVETCEQHEKLVQLHCNEIQGYLFGRPMPAGAFTELLGKGAFDARCRQDDSRATSAC